MDIFGRSRLPITAIKLDAYGCNAYKIDWADNRDPRTAVGGG